MNASVVDIVNTALDYLGQAPIINMEERSPNAARARRMWPGARDGVLRSHIWKCAQKRVRLAKLAARPVFGFAFQYQLPPDFLRLAGTEPGEARFSVEGDRLMADAPELLIAYVARVEDANLFDASLRDCLALKLAAMMAFGATASTALAQSLDAQYRDRLKEARSADAREGEAQIHKGPGRWAAARLG
ncbi:conserved hypothetical protein [uncultured delta proteobacterium]|uniref:Uncharacterized protein n=1 Tax=uncultured delta proteobacterium TaxID=34034 RepID=A0A212JI16_9DELT|nr:conserved hypothetical protein [uncultured delta proteobacterium]